MSDRLWAERKRMVEDQIRGRGVRDAGTLQALMDVPRHLFVPPTARDAAYADSPLAIGHGQTISQPYIVALMTSALQLRSTERVLEVGTGSGYQAAVLSRLAGEIHSIELVPGLASGAARILTRAGCDNVHVHVGDGSLGWPESAPYAAIMVTAAAPAVPEPLIDQLSDPGRMVIPVAASGGYQLLTILRKVQGLCTEAVIASVAFVPLRGQHGLRA